MGRISTILAKIVAALALAPALALAGSDNLDRTVLPIAEPTPPRYHELDARNVTPPPRFEVKPPAGAPNVVIILIDDMGFGSSTTFGGPIPTPTLDALSRNGLRYNNFHTTALCSPTRTALKHGRNHHTLNMSSITETATAIPGNTGQIPIAAAPLAEVLRLNGYSTAAFGKWHETAVWEISPSGPTARWPTLQGFDKFYGFMGAEANQWAPSLRDGMTPVEPPKDPNYHLMIDMTDQAITWLRFQKAMTPDKPFFIYFAPGALHAPHHVPREFIEASPSKGQFAQGWDRLREETLARQLAMKIVPEGTVLAPRSTWIKDWSALSAAEQALFQKQVEVYAAYLEFTDQHIKRLIDAIDATGQRDNTLIFFIAGDNGTSGEGTANGLFNEYTYFNGVQEHVEGLLPLMDSWGGPQTYPHMAAGWSVALDAPFGWMKQVAGDFGGTRNGMVVSWPRVIKAGGPAPRGDRSNIRPQFHHVIDVAPTILEAIGLPEPKVVNGTPQIPLEGVSMLYTFNDAAARDRHTTQYFEIYGNRGIYDNGWFARTNHKDPWETVPHATLQTDVWQLYDVRSDFSLAHDLAAKYPKKLEQMKGLFMREGYRYHVLPIDDRFRERTTAALVGRPDVMAGRTSLTLGEGMTGMGENVFINVKNTSSRIDAVVDVPANARGTILAQGGRFGGFALYMENGVPAYHYNWLNIRRSTVSGGGALSPGPHTISFEFAYEGGAGELGKGGLGTLYVDGAQVGQGRINQTEAGTFSFDEGADVGIDLGTPVVEQIGAGEASRFTGKVLGVTISIVPPSAATAAAEAAARADAILRAQ